LFFSSVKGEFGGFLVIEIGDAFPVRGLIFLSEYRNRLSSSRDLNIARRLRQGAKVRSLRKAVPFLKRAVAFFCFGLRYGDSSCSSKE